MCTAVGVQFDDFYFGRTLDVECGYGQEVVLTPKTFDYRFRFCSKQTPKFDILGMALKKNGYPLYFDGMNNQGLCMAGLRFLEAYYEKEIKSDRLCIAPFEFIPFVLSCCANVSEAEQLLKNVQIVNEDFDDQLVTSPLHWIISDKSGSLTVEATKKGLNVYKNLAGVLTNSPEFPIQMFNLNNYINLSPEIPKNTFCADLPILAYSYGLGGLGLPGDMSSMSRFVRATYYKHNMKFTGDGVENFYYLLNSCRQIKGLTKTETGEYEYTEYTSCCNATKGEYYYKKYGDKTLYKAKFS